MLSHIFVPVRGRLASLPIPGLSRTKESKGSRRSLGNSISRRYESKKAWNPPVRGLMIRSEEGESFSGSC
jgi:hypothetical protein